jgi:hypothetical protein
LVLNLRKLVFDRAALGDDCEMQKILWLMLTRGIDVLLMLLAV